MGEEYNKICDICGEPFISHAYNAMYCNKDSCIKEVERRKYLRNKESRKIKRQEKYNKEKDTPEYKEKKSKEMAIYYQKNKETIRTKSKEKYNKVKDTPEHKKKRHNKYLKNRDDIRAKAIEKYNKEKDTPEYKEKSHNNYLKIKDTEKYKTRKKIWREKNKEKIKKYQKEYKQVEKNKRRRNKQQQRQYFDDPVFYLKMRLYGQFNQAYKKGGWLKTQHLYEIIGCTYEEFNNHIMSLWEPWMNLENKGKYNGEFNYGWDVDHIIPLSTATTKEEVDKLFHYTNLQPLCSHINRDIKRDRTDYYD